LEELYDDRTLAALDRAAVQPHPRAIETRRPRLAGALLQASSLAMRDVFEARSDKDAVVEFRPDEGNPPEQWVTFVYVPGGAPWASRLIVRPWLA
jgi:cobyrinic acid a,c-diamide synthase